MAYRKTSGKPGSTRMAMSSLMEKNPRDHQEVGEELLSNIGRQVLDLLRAGGKSLENMDNQYADAVYDRIGGRNANSFLEYTSTGRLGEMLRTSAENNPAIMAQKYGAIGANIASRYALPAGGVMLAGKGLADLTNGLYDYASEQPIL